MRNRKNAEQEKLRQDHYQAQITEQINAPIRAKLQSALDALEVVMADREAGRVLPPWAWADFVHATSAAAHIKLWLEPPDAR